MAMSLCKECYIVSSGQGSSLARMEEVSQADSQQYLSVVVGEDEALKHVKDWFIAYHGRPSSYHVVRFF